MTAPKVAQQFAVGDKVAAVALPDAFPNPRARVDGLTVTNVRLIECSHIAAYYRVTAHASDGYQYVEGAERFFERVS